MKRVLMIVMSALCALGIWAAPPKLACESVFNRDKLSDDITNLVISTSDESYFRSVRFEKNPALVKRIKSLLEKDRKRAMNVVENYTGNRSNVIFNIMHDGYLINVGFTWTDDGDGRFFVQGHPKAFD